MFLDILSTFFLHLGNIIDKNRQNSLQRDGRIATMLDVEAPNQDELKMNVKLWLKANGMNYAWLAEKCYVTEATVRNWMARKPIPAAKEHIIRELIKQLPISLPSRVKVQEETLVPRLSL